MMQWLNSNTYSRLCEIARFGIVGTIAMVIHYGVYYILSSIINLNLAFSLGYAISFVFNFLASSYFTFRVKPSWARLVKFGGSHGINYLIQLAVFNFALYLGMKPAIAPALVYAISIPANYIMVGFAMKRSLRDLSKQAIGSALVILLIITVYAFTAYNSTGFYYPDEHYQLIEFARWKMGIVVPGAIPWELPAEIRPTLQPVITCVLLRIMEFAGIDNPFRQSFALRVVMTLIMLYSVWRFTKSTSREVTPRLQKAYIILSYLLWFLPFISVHFSSETMAAAMLLLSLAEIFDAKDRLEALTIQRAAKIGMLLGLSFEFRYQMAFLIIGIILWMLIIARVKISKLAVLGIAFVSIVGVCTLCDSMFYGHFTFAPWNYFRENIVNGVAASFGTAPWWAYFTMVLNASSLPIGVVILIAIAYALIYRHKNVVVWAFVFFAVGHMAVAHKELRFMFPIAYLLPLMLTWLAEWFNNNLRAILIMGTMILTVINTGGLVAEMFKPARYGRAATLEQIYSDERIEKVVCGSNCNPYKVSSLSLDTYRRPDMEVDIDVDSYLLGMRHLNPETEVIILNQGDVWQRETAEHSGLQELNRGVPQWIDYLNRFYKFYNPNEVKIIYGH